MAKRRGGEGGAGRRVERCPGTGIGKILTHVSSNLLAGLMEAVSDDPYRGKADLPDIAETLQMEAGDLLPVAEALQMLRFAEIERGDIRLTEAGGPFGEVETDEREQWFSSHLLTYVPLAAPIRRVVV